MGNITVKDGGRLTIGESTLFKNGLDDNVAPDSDDYYKKDIKIDRRKWENTNRYKSL